MGSVFTFGIVQADIENALSVATTLALFDDGDGVLNRPALAAVILRGEQELISWLVDLVGLPLPPDFATDPFLKSAALDFCISFSIERHPEYAKQAGFGTAGGYYERGQARAERIASARQRAATVNEKPANVGGVVVDGSTRLYIANADGTPNAGDF